MDHDKNEIEAVATEIQQIKTQIETLKAVDAKIDGLSRLIIDVRDSIVASQNAISKHELLLEEIRVNADFRKRESENSVREIKTQMIGMEHEIDSRTMIGVDKIIERIDGFERAQRSELEKLTRYFSSEIDHLKKRVLSIERWNTFNILIVLIVVVLVVLFP